MAAVIPAPSAKGPRRQFKIERLLFSRFSCDIFQSRRGAGKIGVVRQESATPASPSFLHLFARYPVAYNSENASLLCSTAIATCPRRDRERIRENEKRISPSFLSIFFSTVIHLTSFCFIRTFTISLEIPYGPMGVADFYFESILITDTYHQLLYLIIYSITNDDTICILPFSTTLASGSSIYEMYHEYI